MAMNLHIYPSTFQNETRILKIIRSLKAHGVFSEIQVMALRKGDLPAHESLGDGLSVIRIAPLFGASIPTKIGTLIKLIGWHASAFVALRGKPIACVNCHSLPVLPLSWMIATWKGAKLVYDTHELETETLSSKGLRRAIARIVERLFIHRCDAVSVVGPSIADWYKERYGLKHVTVVRNVPPAFKQAAPTGKLRAALGLAVDDEIYLYQGLLSRGRGIEALLEAFVTLFAPKHLVFMGYGDLEPEIRKMATLHDNIHFHPAVRPDEIPDYTADATVGLALIENLCLSYYYCLPNKLFEYAACGVPILASDFPEMQHVVQQFDAGWAVKPEAQAIRNAVADLTPAAIAAKKTRLSELATAYRWENEEPQLLAIYRTLGLKA
ncbi:MAG: glycosyltransferase [Rickettsiales bacterium]